MITTRTRTGGPRGPLSRPFPGLTLLTLVAIGCSPPGEVTPSSDLPGGPELVAAPGSRPEVVENPAPAGPPQLRIATEPLLELPLPAPEGDETRSRLNGGVELSDGTLVVADAGRRELVWIAPDGEPLIRRSGVGTAPGSFRALTALVALGGDSVLVYDAQLRAGTPFGPDGEPGQVLSLVGFPVELSPVTRFADGSFLIGAPSGTLPSAAPGPESVYRPIVEYARIAPGGTDRRVLARGPGSEVGMLATPATETGFMHDPRVPWPRTTLVAGRPDGWVTLDTAGHDLWFWSPDGTALAVARRPDTSLRTAGPEERDAWMAGVENQAVRRLLQQIWNVWGETMPQTLPTASALLLDPEGRAWVREFTLDPALPERWNVFTPSGVWLGTVEAPEGIRVLAILHDRVAGVRTAPDTDDDRLVLHSLESGAP